MGQQFITSEQGQHHRCLGLTVRLNHQSNLIFHSLPSYTANPILQLPLLHLHSTPAAPTPEAVPSSAPASSIIQIPPESTGLYGDSTLETCHALSVPSYLWPISSLLWRLLGTAIFDSSLCPSIRVPKEPVQSACSGNNSVADRSSSIHPNVSEFLTWSRRMDNYSLALAICYAFTPQGVWIAVKLLSRGKQKVTLKGRVKGRKKSLCKLLHLCWPLGHGKKAGAIRRQRWDPWLALMWLWAGAFPCLNSKGQNQITTQGLLCGNQWDLQDPWLMWSGGHNDWFLAVSLSLGPPIGKGQSQELPPEAH